ncbi:MAG: diacylglycerol/lipid kinase family protein [Nocardioides sp.]
MTSPRESTRSVSEPTGSPTRSFCFLVNPSSGGGAAPEAVVPVARLLRDAGAQVEVTYSPGPQAMRVLVDAALDRGAVVVSVGGDGMLSSLAGPVAQGGGVLGVLPAGRGNDFARMLDLPTTPEAQAELFLAGPTRAVDLVSYGDRLVAGSVYAGVDARAAEIVDRARLVPVRFQYPYAALRSLATYRPGRYRVAVDGEAREYSAATVVVANSAYYGQGMRIAPAATLSDGLLDVVVVEAASRIALMRALPSLYDGSHVERGGVHVLTGRRIELSSVDGSAIRVGGDGEPLGVLPGPEGRPAVVEVRPGALTVVAR